MQMINDILLIDLEPTCSEKNEFYTCGPPKMCEPVCNVALNTVCNRVKFNCEKKCNCKPGFIRNNLNVCVEPEDCN